MKKIIALLLALAMVLSLAACGGSSAPAASEAPKADAPAADAPAAEAPAAEAVTIKVAAIEYQFFPKKTLVILAQSVHTPQFCDKLGEANQVIL